MKRDLTGLFSPKSIAIVGASHHAEKVGGIALNNVIISGFKGKVYPINPTISVIGGLKCYPDVASLPEIPDLALVAIPVLKVNQVMEEIGQKGIKNVVIFSAGFKEAGKEGEELEKELIEITNKYQLNVLGPNCLGFVNNDLPVNATFGQVIKKIGNLRIISQSGAIAASLFDWCESTNLGFKEFITVGNKASLNENDILQFWSELPSPENLNEVGISKVFPIGLYLESISQGEEFLKLATKVSQTNPLFVLKPGKSKAAIKAMHSHTGSIAGEDSILEIAFKQAGIIRCQELGDFFDLARAMAWENAPLGPKVAVISNAGGPAVLSTDTISSVGLELAEFREKKKQKLSTCLPRIASFVNPVDVLGDALADRFGQALEIVLQEHSVQAVIIILTPQLMTQIEKTAELISNLSKIYSQPIFCSFIGGGLTAQGEKVLNDNQIPSFPFPERAIKTLALMWQWQKWRLNYNQKTIEAGSDLKNLEKIKDILAKAESEGRDTLNNLEANEILMAAEIPTPATLVVKDCQEAEAFAVKNGWPVVIKMSAPGLLHKSDIGGVITDIEDSEQLMMAWKSLTKKIEVLDAEIKSKVQIQVQKQIKEGVETIIGMKRDANFGAVLLFGSGGHLVDLLPDRNLHLLPLDKMNAQRMVSESKIFPILNGYRGEAPYDLERLYDVMVKIGQLALNCPNIAEIEINPMRMTHEGSWALDAKVILGKS